MIERPFSHELIAESGPLVLHGDLHELGAREIRTLIQTVTEDYTRDLTVDLSDLDLLPSSAVGVLAVAREKAGQKGATIRFVATDGSLAARVLEVCRLPYTES